MLQGLGLWVCCTTTYCRYEAEMVAGGDHTWCTDTLLARMSPHTIRLEMIEFFPRLGVRYVYSLLFISSVSQRLYPCSVLLTPIMPSRAKKYGQSCLTCRRRKVRCDGGRPACAKCLRINEHCAYNVHDSTVTRLQNALIASEQRLQELERDLRALLLLEPTQCRESLRSLTESFGQRLDEDHHGEYAQSGTPDRASIQGSGNLLAARQPDQETPVNDDGSTDEEENEEVHHPQLSLRPMLILPRGTVRLQDSTSRNMNPMPSKNVALAAMIPHRSNITNDG